MASTAGNIMGARGDAVATAGAGDRLRDVAATLRDRRIGAVVVTDDDRRVVGMLSERDIIRRLADAGAACLEDDVATVMTESVTTCTPTTTADELMRTMTDGRFRHVPVLDDDGRLAGIVSVGDVVKHTIDQLRVEKDSLAEYVTGNAY